MIFAIQTYLEDYFNKNGLNDSDGYSVDLANIYFHHRTDTRDDLFYQKIFKIKTVFFLNNRLGDRKDFEKKIISRLDNKFKKKVSNDVVFPGGIEKEQEKILRSPRLTIESFLKEFCFAIEARAIDAFWESRKKGILQKKPEKIGQGLFAAFTEGILMNRNGVSLKELQSGIGFVDFGVLFSTTLHLVEIKIMTDRFEGISQLEQYMKIERRHEGSLVVFDSKQPHNKLDLPKRIRLNSGLIKIYPVDINPPAPSKLK